MWETIGEILFWGGVLWLAFILVIAYIAFGD
jgi:hypothetical protein